MSMRKTHQEMVYQLDQSCPKTIPQDRIQNKLAVGDINVKCPFVGTGDRWTISGPRFSRSFSMGYTRVLHYGFACNRLVDSFYGPGRNWKS